MTFASANGRESKNLEASGSDDVRFCCLFWLGAGFAVLARLSFSRVFVEAVLIVFRETHPELVVLAGSLVVSPRVSSVKTSASESLSIIEARSGYLWSGSSPQQCVRNSVFL